MKRFIEGADREQTTLFPERLEDYVGNDNPVRVLADFNPPPGLAIRGGTKRRQSTRPL